MGYIPMDCYYTRDHEWIWISKRAGFIGITEHAQRGLGDVVYVVLPIVGDKLKVGDIFGSVESLRGRSELRIPVTGQVIEINENLIDAPELVNEDPYGDGWMIKVAFDDSGDISHLLTAAEYADYIKTLKKRVSEGEALRAGFGPMSAPK
jgi:glycine cleavage system H protein